MATDSAVQLFLLPVILCVIAFLTMAVYIKPKPYGQGFLKLGGKRIACGYLGVMLVMLIYAYFDAYMIGMEKLELGRLTVDMLWQRVLSWGMYLFIMVTPLVLFIMTVLGLPFLALLSRFGYVSLAGVIVFALIFTLGSAALTYLTLNNSQCESQLLECIQDIFINQMIPAVLLTLGFGLGARLPLLKGEKALSVTT